MMIMEIPLNCISIKNLQERDLARAAAKASSWNGFGCVRYFVRLLQVLVRIMDYTRVGMARCAVACEAPAGRAISVGFGAIAYNVEGVNAVRDYRQNEL